MARAPRAVAHPPRASHAPELAALMRESSRSRRRFYFWVPIVAALATGAFLFVQKGGMENFTKPAPAVADASAVPEPSAPATPAAAPATPAATAAPATSVRARIEAVRAIGRAHPQVERADFPGAAAVLDSWLAANAAHEQRATVEREAARLHAAAKTIPDMLAQPAPLIGAQIPVGNSVWPVASVSGSRLIFRVQAQFGVVERAVEVAALGEPARVQLLQRADAARQTDLAAIYLLALRKADAAHAAIREESAQAGALRSAADEVAGLVRDGEVLAALDHAAGLMTRGQLASAQAHLDQMAASFPNHDFLLAYAPQIDAWRSQIASAPAPEAMTKPVATAAMAASDGYPGVPLFSLSTAVKAGDPDRQQLLFAAQWAASTGNWSRHFTALKDAIGAAAGQGPWQQHPYNIERLLTLGTPVLAVEQAKFIRAVGSGTLATFSAEEASKDFLNWLFARPQVLAAFSETIQPQDKAANALLQWRTIWNDDAENRDKLSGLAIACALVFDEPIKINPNIYGFDAEYGENRTVDGPTEASAMARYRFYRDCWKKGSLKVSLPEMTPWELVWVVDAPVPESELIWAQKYVNFSRREWGKAYGHIRYRMDRAAQGVNPYKAYTLAEIEKEGGICGDQAYFAAMSAKANGIPAMVIGGEGDRGGHAWFGYGIARNDWNLNTGRYADNYAAGTTRDPQTGRTIKEHELRQLTDPARRTANFDKSEKLLALASLLNEASKRDLATLAYDGALRAAPKNYDAWVAKLDNLAAAKVPKDEWLRESARMRTTFREFSDMVQEIDKREVAYVTANGDTDAARALIHRQTARMQRKDGERTDLILDSVFREADLSTQSGDIAGAGRVYRDALRDKGEEVVAFRRIADRYYGWGKANSKGPDVAKDLVAYFDRKHNEPTGDVFAIGAYRGVLRTLSGMAKEQNLDVLQRRLDRREEKLKKLEEKLGELQSRGADR